MDNSLSNQKTLLKNIAVHWQKGTAKVLVGVLDYQYNIEIHPIQINNLSQTGMTEMHFSAISSVLSKYKLDKNTTVLLPRCIPSMHPCNVWFRILRTQLEFSIVYKDMSDMIKRLLKPYRSLLPLSIRKSRAKTKQLKNIKKEHYSNSDFLCVWNNLVKYEICPWINSQTNIALFSNNSDKDYSRMQKIYVALYYMIVRKHYIDKNNTSA